MAMYDRQYFLDVRAIMDKASVLKQTPPQDVVKAVEMPVVPWPKPEDLDFSGLMLRSAD